MIEWRTKLHGFDLSAAQPTEIELSRDGEVLATVKAGKPGVHEAELRAILRAALAGDE